MYVEVRVFEFALLTQSQSFAFCTARATLGRDPRCTFVLPDTSVLPLHAVIFAEDGFLYLQREHRDALTFHNRVPLRHRIALCDGDLIDIGPWTLMIRSRQLPRRADDAHSVLQEATPTDQAIIRSVRVPGAPPRRFPTGDTSSSIIII